MSRIAIALQSVRREAANGPLYAVDWFLRRFLLRFPGRWLRPMPEVPPAGGRPVAIVIPAVEKDAAVLEECLAAVRQFVRDPIAALWVVAPDSPKIAALAAAAGAELVHEDKILPRPARELKVRGWVLQQLIKLNASRFVPVPDYVVLDADTVFLRPRTFFRGGRSLLYYSDQYELLYNPSLERVFGHRRRYPVSFVTHHLLLRAPHVQALLDAVEQRFNRPWWEAIVQEIDRGHLISFSEYEFYGNFVMADPVRRREYVLQYWHGLDADLDELPGLPALRAALPPRLSSVSYHRHTQ